MDSRQIFVLIVMASAVVVFLGVIMFFVWSIQWETRASWKRLLDAVDSYMRSKKESPAKGLKQATLENFYTLLEDKKISVDWCYTEGLNQCRPTSGEMTISIVDEETGKRRCIYKAAYDPYAKRWEEREHKR